MSYPSRGVNNGSGRSRMGLTARVVILLAIVGFGFIQYLSTTKLIVNPYTGESQRIALSPQQEVQLGLESVPKMVQMHGGEHRDSEAQATVDRVGARLVEHVNQTAKFGDPIGYPFEFHLLADENMINAFALPGGQIFITYALYKQLENEDQLAGVLGHEIGHVVAKHSNEQMSKSGFLKSIGTGVAVALGGDGGAGTAQLGAMVNQVLATKYGREDEYESDRIGCWLLLHAGYNPQGMLGVLEILKRSASGPRPPEMLSTHPLPENRIDKIKAVLAELPKS